MESPKIEAYKYNVIFLTKEQRQYNEENIVISTYGTGTTE